MRVRIDDQDSHMFATLWIASCIHLHNFAMAHENKENPEADQFFIDGQRYLEEEQARINTWREARRIEVEQEEENYMDEEAIELLEGKIKREELKKELFRYLEL